MVSLVDIPFSLNLDQLFEQLRIKPGTDRAKEFEDLARMVRETGKPKALYKVSFIDEKGEDTVTLDGVIFKSLALRKNLESVGRVFPYIATCGTEIDAIEVGQGNVHKKMWLSLLKGILLQTGIDYLREHLDRLYRV